jgi:hypothetical protein
MDTLRPRVYGWRLAAGVVLWVPALVAGFLAAAMWSGDPFGELPLILVAVAVTTVVIAAGFWRGKSWARWLAILPAIALFLGAIAWFLLSGLCVAGAVQDAVNASGPLALSCPEPRPERSIMSWLVTAGLAALGAVVLVGVARPGVSGD